MSVRAKGRCEVDFKLLVVKAARRVRRIGLQATLREVVWFLKHRHTSDGFDLRHGTDTGGFLPLWNFKISSPNARYGVAYQSIGEEALLDAIGALREDPHFLTFVDLGCGKGRALLVAASLGFKQVIGVEFAQELAEIAKENVTRLRIANAVVVQTDAAKYRFPNTDMVLYLFNPFSEEVMQKVIENLKGCVTRKLYVIYVVPVCAGLFDACGFLTRLSCPPGRMDILIWSGATATHSEI